MALPGFLAPSLTPQELTFLAEQEEIEIVPAFTMSPVRLIQGVYGPFRPLSKTKVPLWLALSLKRKRRARVVCPEWLTTENLQNIIIVEKEQRSTFVPLPRYFFEVSKLLLDIAPSDLQNSTQVQSLFTSLRHVRLAKLRRLFRPPSTAATQNPYYASLSAEDGGAEADVPPLDATGELVELTGLTPVEIAEVRAFLKGSMNVLKGLSEGAEGGDNE